MYSILSVQYSRNVCSSESVQFGVCAVRRKYMYIHSGISAFLVLLATVLVPGLYSIDGTRIKTWSAAGILTDRGWQVPRENPRNVKCLRYQTHFRGYVKLCLLAKLAEILCNDTAPSSLIKYFCTGMWRPCISVTRSRGTSVLWITIEMQPLYVLSRATWCHTTSYCCSNHVWQCCCMSAHAVTCQSQHALRVSLTPALPHLTANAWLTVNVWDFWRGFKFCHNIVDENSSLLGYEILLFWKQVPIF
jgi:hypothetical protein